MAAKRRESAEGPPPDILVVEPFYCGSHKQLVDCLMLDGDIGPRVHLVTMSGKKWHWRARVSALHLSTVVPAEHHFRVLFSSSVLNLAELVALRPDLAGLHKVLYFHENQLQYPVRKQKDRDFQYGYNQILSCLVADCVLFNSNFNMESFLASINSFLKLMPDYRPRGLADTLRPKCSVLYFPMLYQNISVCLAKARDQLTDSAVPEQSLHAGVGDDSGQGAHGESSSCDAELQTSKADDSCSCDPTLQHHQSDCCCVSTVEEQGQSRSRVEDDQVCGTGQSVCEGVGQKAPLQSQTEETAVKLKEKHGTNRVNPHGTLSSQVEETCETYKVKEADGSCPEQIAFVSVPQERNDEDRTLQNQNANQCTDKTDGSGCIHIVWPHRWEHDKDPETFFQALFRLHEEGLPFAVSVLGEMFTDVPDIFAEAEKVLKEHIHSWGYQPSKSVYYQILQTADVVVSTSKHEFFGVAMLEAVFLGCYPLCPKSLVYPEIYPEQCLYSTPGQLYKRLRSFCRQPCLARSASVQVDVQQFSWENLRRKYLSMLLIKS